ncbi:hypothetical protein ACTD5D_20380 [Nocardia takedensis]|uniref:hypothetical protein n=1 Tax=Nocardia takedensis TaxID=259390 RepID=UPI003F75AD67
MATSSDTFWDELEFDDPAPTPAAAPLSAVTPVDQVDAVAARHDWADELDLDLERMNLAPGTGTGRRRRRVRLLLVAAGTIATAVLISVGDSGDGDSPAREDGAARSTSATTVAPSSVAARLDSPGAAGEGCVARVEGETVVGAGRGDTDSGPGAILAFEAAYYLDRSGVKARESAVVDAALPSAAAIQAGIDSVPAGTTHCVRITPAGPDRWLVDLSEQRPDQPAQLHRQSVTTTGIGGRVLITGITAR